ncbi:hypothetical protein GE061_000313 [Apolygus lucorum]|uniref:LSM domain-containing protein n=1 Tax=Apolygus lucorum TaxID=248454 RepID=A0A6A4K8K2_APOLU|nr:hypothetical protein GE061_000313 [Apolygus lucorum]
MNHRRKYDMFLDMLFRGIGNRVKLFTRSGPIIEGKLAQLDNQSNIKLVNGKVTTGLETFNPEIFYFEVIAVRASEVVCFDPGSRPRDYMRPWEVQDMVCNEFWKD